MNSRLNVVLCWHMHQPYYRDGLEGEYRLPWVYLHGIKDYTDMVAHLERHPLMRAVVNFTPVLLEQIDDYSQQIDRFLSDGRPTQDRMLNLLAGVEPIPADAPGREQLLRDCQRCHAPRMIHPYPPFSRLLRLAGVSEDPAISPDSGQHLLRYLGDQYFLDVLTWYHLAWLGHSLRDHADVRELMERAEDFTLQYRRKLVVLIRDALSGLMARYRALADRGQIELSMTPYGHPIIPLMDSFDNMNCSMPEAPHPESETYPGGEARSEWHVAHGIEMFEQYLGRKPAGVWLAEGGLSEDALRLLDRHGIRWTASGEGVWRNSCRLSGIEPGIIQSKKPLFSPNLNPDASVRMFFRDDGLSDLIGFRYNNWHAEDAVADFIQHLNNIAAFLGAEAEQHVVSVILDGENAWEYYPDNGHHFLDGLYSALESSQRLRVSTFADCAEHLPPTALPQLCAGSWVYGSFSTWIGSPDKNRGWDYLVSAKRACDEVLARAGDDEARALQIRRQLAICEGSDWFWWFGDYNPADSVSDFERLYREQLRALYVMLGEVPPAQLDVPLSRGGGQAENAGTMRRNA